MSIKTFRGSQNWPPYQLAAVKAITEAMSRVYVLVIAAGALLTVSSLLMKGEKVFSKVAAGGWTISWSFEWKINGVQHIAPS